ncbi:MAG: POTRA domain-containing protein, partial [Planctomycetota bacterium]
MDRALLPGCRLVLLCLLVATAAAHGKDALAQDEALLDRPVSAVEIDGLERVPRQLVFNQIRTTIGDPYDPDIVRGDVRRLTRLAEFRHVDVTAEVLDDGTVAVTFTLDEMPILNEVQVVGNRLINDQELKGVIGMRAGDPRDDFRIEKAKRSVEALYRQRGHYLTTVTIDERELEESSLLIFRIIEGSRVKVR